MIRTLRSLLFACSALAVVATPVMAQQFPSKPLRWVAPSSPGSGSDIAARFIGEKISRELGQPVVIDNKPGAGGTLGSRVVAKAAADGYTMVVGNAGSHGINAAIYTRLDYDIVKDFAPVALFCTSPNVMVVSLVIKAQSINEFVTLAKANPGKFNYASGGTGSSAHMSAELFKSMTGTNLTHVPYNGGGAAVTSVLANESQLMIGNLPPWVGVIKSGKVQALAVTTAKRHASLPNVPAMSEVLPGYETVAWFGLLAPVGTPRAIVERLNKLANQALQQPDMIAKFDSMSCDPAAISPEAFGAQIVSAVARWKKLAAEKNIRAI